MEPRLTKRGYLDNSKEFRRAVEETKEFEPVVFEELCGQGHLSNLEYYVEHHGMGEEWVRKLCLHLDLLPLLAGGDRVEIVEYLMSRGLLPEDLRAEGKGALMITVREGHLRFLKFLLDQGLEVDDPSVVNLAAMEGHLEIVKYLIEELNFSLEVITSETLTSICQKGCLSVLKYLIDSGLSSDKLTSLDSSIEGGNLTIVTYLIAQGVRNFSMDSLIQAISQGHLNILTYLMTYEGLTGFDLSEILWELEPTPLNQTTLQYIASALEEEGYLLA